ncbi:hypothetical protein DBZ36_15455 [Alginatibacterium sediminis]|uniref:Cytochrome P460 domain-containing protein n=1 Tax=Alginatibacterium sediminis TaxID=2164068 RepID=A0A420E8P9_9ALTE|nr:cytochrome P460 family protein [Alginatibacterium sediminis]RKF15771.1 hypothetical protein DBZ36_15455 [Alginatibacterium sediminis]
MMLRIMILTSLLLCNYVTNSYASLADPADTFGELVDDTGTIAFPHAFQTQLVHLGTTAVVGENMLLKNLNGIYTQEASIEIYNQTGLWPDGTVFVKDVKHVSSERLSTGLVYHQQNNDIFFVMVKDTQQRFTQNQHWGEGWGWAMFGQAPEMNESPNRQFCQACHAPRESNDWLFTDQYPALLKQK